MKEVIVQIPEKNYPFFLELVKSLGFAKLKKANGASTKRQILHDLQDSVYQVNQIKAGKLKGIKARDILKEL